MHQQPAQELLDTVDDIKENIRWGDDLNYEITQQQINGWLATQLNGNPHVSLPDGIRNPRIRSAATDALLYSRTITIYFGHFHTTHDQVGRTTEHIEIKLSSLHGNLPIRIKRVFDEIESAMARSVDY